jgi:hypothetical protein
VASGTSDINNSFSGSIHQKSFFNNSPRNKANEFVKRQVGEFNLNPIKEEAPVPKHKKKASQTISLNEQLLKQTLASSIKTRSITKNNFYMPKISNKKFVPVNKSEAKEHIFRTVQHDTEQEKYGKDSKNNSPTNFEKGLSDPFFASKLDSMGNSKISF